MSEGNNIVRQIYKVDESGRELNTSDDVSISNLKYSFDKVQLHVISCVDRLRDILPGVSLCLT